MVSLEVWIADALAGGKMSRNAELLKSFTEYCEKNPTQRFWQALRNWSGHNFILVTQNKDEVKGQYEDTFYWEGLNKRKE